MKQYISNDLYKSNSTKDQYNLNKLYDEYVFQKVYYPYYFDGREEKKLYGFVDSNNNPVYPKISSLKQYQNVNGNTHSNLPFVVDAFKELKAFQEKLVYRNRSSNNSIFTILNVNNSTTLFHNHYDSHISNLYEIFENRFLAPVNKNSIFNVNTFMQIFVKYLKIVCASNVINRSTFLKSKYADPSINGIRISIDSVLPYSDVTVKSNIYVGNPEFDLYVDNAARFGFFVDKNFPWTIVADLESPSMKKYMSFYDIYSAQQMFEKYYHNTYEADIESLKSIILIFWNKFTATNSFTKTTEVLNCKNIFIESGNFADLTQQNFDLHYSSDWIIRLYCYTRILEEKLNLTQNKFESIYEEAIKINNYFNTLQAVKFINTRIKDMIENEKNVDHLTDKEQIAKISHVQRIHKSYEELIF